MKNRYLEMKRKHQEQINKFPLKFAFSKDQVEEGLKELGVTKKEVVSIGAGGFLRKNDLPRFKKESRERIEEMEKAIADDKTGEGFIYEMFYYELNNHEYCVTYSITDTVEGLGMTEEEVYNSESLLNGINKAKKQIQKEMEMM